MRNVEIAQLVARLSTAHHADPVAQLVLLQKLFRQILDIALGVGNGGGGDGYDGARAGDRDVVAEGTGLAVDLDAVVQVVFKGGSVKDAVVGGAGAVDGKVGTSGSGGFLHIRVVSILLVQKSRAYQLGHVKVFNLTGVSIGFIGWLQVSETASDHRGSFCIFAGVVLPGFQRPH